MYNQNVEFVGEDLQNGKGNFVNQSVYDEIFQFPNKSVNFDRNNSVEEMKPSAVSDKSTGGSGEGLPKSDYDDLAYAVKNDRSIGFRLQEHLDKGLAGGKFDVNELKKSLEKYGLQADLKPLESGGLQLTISNKSDGSLVDSTVSKTLEARRMSVEMRYQEKLKDPDVKKFVDQFKDALKSKVVSLLMLDSSLRKLGEKALDDQSLQKMMKELGKIEGIDFRFDKDKVTMSRTWQGPADPGFRHSESRVDISAAFNGSNHAATSDSSPYGKGNKRTVGLEEAGKALFTQPDIDEKYRIRNNNMIRRHR